MLAVEPRNWMTAYGFQFEVSRKAGVSSLAEQASFTNRPRQFFHPKDEMQFLALQALFTH